MNAWTARWLARTSPLWLTLALSCKPKDGPDAQDTDTDEDTDTVLVGPSCGDGVVDDGEACDDGEANSDTAPDACRTTCTLPTCGDGVTDAEEGCDDQNELGGDGCSPGCVAESLPGEVEPNDIPATASPVTAGVGAMGGLSELDIDCWAVEVEDNGWLDVRATGPDGTCPPDLVIRLYDLDDDEVAMARGGDEEGACAHLNPSETEDAAYLDGGVYTVCVEGLLRSAVPVYRLVVETGDDSCLGFDPPPEDDPDGDGLANACDADDDDDGVPDTTDKCPLVSDGPATPIARTPTNGFIQDWMIAAGIRGDAVGSDGACDPSDVSRLGTDDATAVPSLGESPGGVPLRLWHEEDGNIAFADLSNAASPREVYAVTWVKADAQTEANLYVGADDGVVGWVEGVRVGEDEVCKGVTIDHLSWPVTLKSGWNRVTIKVRDHGGGWGLVARFKDLSGNNLDGLEVSPTGPARWNRNQADRDGDGLGDACDPEP